MEQERETFEAWGRDRFGPLVSAAERAWMWDAWQARAAIAAQQAAPGWVLVPKEATPEMCAAAVRFANGNAVYKNVAAEALKIEEAIYGEVYEAMLAAAPSAQQAAQPLTDERIQALRGKLGAAASLLSTPTLREIVRATEAAHGIAAEQPKQASKMNELAAPPMGALMALRMQVCPDCGNKRCPRAVSNLNACSGSNDPSQGPGA